MAQPSPPATPSWIPAADTESMVTVLGVIYVHRRTADGGDIYLTRFGLPWAEHLEVDNWYELEWFRQHREALDGTSSVYRVPTRRVGDCSLDLVVKNCRVGEDVPVATRALLAEINAEFNSPWEEFALVMELRQGRYGPRGVSIRTQEPLAIYVPPETMQVWQTGRSRYKINRIRARHPGIDLDVLKQYKLIYRWIPGEDVVQIFSKLAPRDRVEPLLQGFTDSVNHHLISKGYVVADMKAAHVIIEAPHVSGLYERGAADAGSGAEAHAVELIERGEYAVVDYELLMRSPEHEERVKQERRHSYLDDVRDCFTPTELPAHLELVEILGVPYVYGHVESTGGKLWVVGRNARLFDYFLPERWRKTPSWRLSTRSEIYYTVTKDRVNLVWKESRVGEIPIAPEHHPRPQDFVERGYNSPFEEYAVAQALSQRGVPTVFVRAIYKTGTPKVEASMDRRRYESHRELLTSDGTPILRDDRNYITLRGFYSGPEVWVAAQTGGMRWPLSLRQASSRGIVSASECQRVMQSTQQAVASVGFDAELLDGSDLIVGMSADGSPVRAAHGSLDLRISNFELIRPIGGEISEIEPH